MLSSRSRGRLRSEAGLGLVQILISVGVLVTMTALLLTYLSNTNLYEAKMRTNTLEKKSFGGAEQALINQRQCRCNMIDPVTTGGGVVSFPASPVPASAVTGLGGTTVSLVMLKTYYHEDTCTDVSSAGVSGSGTPIPADDILSDTTPAATTLNQSRSIQLINFTIVIPNYLYRATLQISPTWAAPISFPLLLVTEPAPGGNVTVDICGVDRAS